MKQKKMKQKRMRKIGIASALGLVVLVVLGLYGASNYMLNYSLNYPKEERMTAEHWKNRMKNECPWMVGWMDSVYQHHCVKDTFVTMPSGYKAHAIYLYAPKTTEKTAVVVHGYQVRSVGNAAWLVVYRTGNRLQTCSLKRRRLNTHDEALFARALAIHP